MEAVFDFTCEGGAGFVGSAADGDYIVPLLVQVDVNGFWVVAADVYAYFF